MIKKAALHRARPLGRFATSAMVLVLMTGIAQAQGAKRDFAIAPQPLDQALLTFSQQADIDVVASGELTRGRTARGVRGSLSPALALDRLLAGTGLRAVRGTDGSIVLVQDASRPFPEPGGADSATTETEADGGTLEEIVVTAQKRVEGSMDVPASISVVTGKQLERMGATQLSDFAGYVPGLNLLNGGAPGKNRINLRGISAVSDSATVGTYIDDTPLGSSSSFASGGSLALDLFPYDVAQIEVLRGPQGTLYGASTMGGLLKYTTRAPDLRDFEMRVGGDLSMIRGSDDPSWGLRAGLNAPLVEGKLAVRGSLFRQDSAGYIDNAFTGEADENGVRQTGGRIALLWKPTHDISIKLAFMKQHIEADDTADVALDPLTLKPAFGDLTTAHGLPRTFDQKLTYYSGILNWDLGWADLVSASSYSRTRTRSLGDISEGYAPLLDLFGVGPGYVELQNPVSLNKFTQEVRLVSDSNPASRIEWMIGAFYTDEKAKLTQQVAAFGLDYTPIPGFENLAFAQVNSAYEEFAVFGNLTYKFSDAFDVTVGGRWARNNQDYRQTTDGLLFGFVHDVAEGQSAESVGTFSVASRYHLNDDTMLYVRVASGYRPGGPNLLMPGIPQSFDADRLVNYEAGLKSRLLDGRASVELSIFRIDWDDIQIIRRGATANYFGNGGTARSQGVELTTALSPVRGLNLGFNMAYTDAKLTEDIIGSDVIGDPPIALDGDPLPTVSKWTSSVTVDKEFPLSNGWMIRTGGGLRFIGPRNTYFASDALNNTRLRSSVMLDLNAAISTGRWQFRIFAKNLTDERAYMGGQGTGIFLANIYQPRTIGLSLDTTF
ncbi:TonB-dependent receptor [Sphingosinicella rhizophila]|uniref:TonB-dependent receptor n=1 Tax=Sphingosinicella rhizophila TaxID=3050082 RepID=A0ABU3QBB0_9SPHN|nr:TonB-dependent receptor [Sphingosinicella sp. GR2756]MDT9600612.1 TonB-dependent receptor [Sphingosinicella sp. GR2756]